MNMREILTHWGFKIDHEKLEKTEEQLEAIKERLSVITGIELAKGLYELGEKFSKFAEQINVAAESAGISVEAFQKLSFAAGQSAVSTEEMEHSMLHLSRALYEAKTKGGEAAISFARAGFTGPQINSFKTSQDALFALSDRFSKMKDPIEKQALAMQLLGRGSLHMVGFLSQGSNAVRAHGEEIEKYGAILSEGQVEGLVGLEHSFNKLWAVIKGISATIAAAFAPAITATISHVLKLVESNRELISINIERWVFNVTYSMGFLTAIFERVIKTVLYFAKALHIDKDLLPLIMKIAGWITAMISLGASFKLAATLWGWFTGALGLALKPIQLLWSGIGLLGKGLMWFANTTRLAAAATWLFEGAMAVLTSPITLVIAAIAALVFVGHELYALFTGKQTWTGQFVKWLETLKPIQVVLQTISEIWAKISGGAGAAMAKMGHLFGIGGGEKEPENGEIGPGGEAKNASFAPGSSGGIMSQVPDQLAAASASQTTIGGASQSYQVNAPINVSVPPGTHPESVGKHVKSAIKDHLDQVYRETRRGTQTAVAY